MGVAADETRRGTYPRADKKSSDALHVVYTPNPEVSPETEARALAAVYAFVLERHQQKEAAAEVGDSEHEIERKGSL